MKTVISQLWFDFKKSSFNRTKVSAIRAELDGLTLRIEDISHAFSAHQSYEARMISLLRKVDAFVSALAKYDKYIRGLAGGTPRLSEEDALARVSELEAVLVGQATALYQHVRSHVDNNEFDGLFFHELATRDCLTDVALDAVVKEACHLPDALSDSIATKLTSQQLLAQSVSAQVEDNSLSITVKLIVQYTLDGYVMHQAESATTMPLEDRSMTSVFAALRSNKSMSSLYKNAADAIIQTLTLTAAEPTLV